MFTSIRRAMTARRDALLTERKDEGFTLIELLIVVLIIGVLAAIAVPVYLSTVDNARKGTTETAAAEARTSVLAYLAEGNDFPTGADASDFGIPANSDISYVITGGANDFCITTRWQDSDIRYSAGANTAVQEGDSCAVAS